MKIFSVLLIYFTLIFFQINCLYSNEQMTQIGILTSSDYQVEVFKDNIANKKEKTIQKIKFIEGKIDDKPVVLASTGNGKVNASMITTLLIDHFDPKIIVSIGMASELNQDLLPGDIVIAEKVAQYDLSILSPIGFQSYEVRNPIDGTSNPIFLFTCDELLTIAETSSKQVEFEQKVTNRRAPKIKKGIILTGDLIISDPLKKDELNKLFHAEAIETEGGSIAQVCWQQGVKCLIIRGIKKTSNEEDDIDRVMEFNKTTIYNLVMFASDIVKRLSISNITKDNIRFVDPNLEAIIRKELHKTEGPITKNELLKLNMIPGDAPVSPDKKIRDLTGIERCVNLRAIFLPDNEIKDITPISSLLNLDAIILSFNKISDINPLSNLTNLRMIELSGNQITDIRPLCNLINIEHLSLALNQISDVSPLISNPGIGKGDYINLGGNPLNDEAYDCISVLQEKGVEIRFDQPK